MKSKFIRNVLIITLNFVVFYAIDASAAGINFINNLKNHAINTTVHYAACANAPWFKVDPGTAHELSTNGCCVSEAIVNVCDTNGNCPNNVASWNPAPLCGQLVADFDCYYQGPGVEPDAHTALNPADVVCVP
jgi:hypothetical protein